MNRAAYTEALNERIRRTHPHWRELGLAGGNPLTTTFPGVGLRTRAMIALNPDFTQDYTTWNWVDITRTVEGTSIVRWEQQISIIYGGRANSPVVDASTCQFRATNDKRFSRRNPLSPYYGQLSEYTPLWIQLDYGQGWKDRYFGFIHDFSKAWDRSGNDPHINLTGRGPLHRIAKSKPLKSPLFRSTISRATSTGTIVPHEYWSLEDGSASTRFLSAVGGSPGIGVLGPDLATAGELPRPAGFSGIPGSATSALLPAGSEIICGVRPYLDEGQWALQVAFGFEEYAPEFITTVTLNSGIFISVRAENNIGQDGLSFDYVAFTMPGFIIIDEGVTEAIGEFTGVPLSIAFFSNSNEFGAKLLDETGTVLAELSSALITHETVQLIELNNDWDPAEISLGVSHLAFFTSASFDPDVDFVNGAKALGGYNLEPAVRRLRRLCAEEKIPFTSQAPEADSALCGPQTVGNLIDALRIPELIDGGTIYEHKFGLGYLSLAEFQNRSVEFTLDASLSQILNLGQPVDNDLDFVNQWTVSRTSGSSVTVSGRKGEAGVTLADTELVYGSSRTLPVPDDNELESYAGRLVHQTTIDEDRWPTVAFNLAAHPELIETWIAFPFGGRINALNVYEEVGVRTLDQIHRGHAESWNSTTWDVSLNCSPASVFNTLEIDNDTYGRIDGESSTLLADITEADTSFLVTTSDLSELWTTEAEDFPLDAKLYSGSGEAISSGGETMRIAAIDSVFRDTFTRTETDTFGTADSGGTYTQTAGPATALSVNGSRGVITHDTLVTKAIRLSVTPIMNFDVRGQVIHSVVPTGGNADFSIRGREGNGNVVDMRIFFTTSNTVTYNIRQVKNSAETLSAFPAVNGATATDLINWRFRAWDGFIYAKAWLSTHAEPLHWRLQLAVDLNVAGLMAMQVFVGTATNPTPFNTQIDNLDVMNPQTFTVDERATNGITKAHKAGTIVRVDPMSVFG